MHDVLFTSTRQDKVNRVPPADHIGLRENAHPEDRDHGVSFPGAIPFRPGISSLLLPYFVISCGLWLIHGRLLISFIILPARKETESTVGTVAGLPWWRMAFPAP